MFHCNCNAIGVEAADVIATTLSSNLELQKLELGFNNIQTEGAIKISGGLQHHKKLSHLVSHAGNNVCGKAADNNIAAFLLKSCFCLILTFKQVVLSQ